MASSSELSHEESGISLSDNDLLAREDDADNPSEVTPVMLSRDESGTSLNGINADSVQLARDNADVYSEVHPVMVQANETLTVAEVYNFLSNANSKYEEYISNEPPVKPRGGSIFLFDLGKDETVWDHKRRQLRYVYRYFELSIIRVDLISNCFS